MNNINQEEKEWYIEKFGQVAWKDYITWSEEFDKKYSLGWIYFLKWAFYIKIGMTIRTPQQRIAEINLLLPYESKLY